AIEVLGLAVTASPVRAGLVACTGATGCRFAAARTKENAEEIAAWCDEHVALNTPVNIHLTGCHHSCAQHYIGDIGLLAAKVAVSEEGDTVEGYHLTTGGGFGPDAGIGQEVYRDVKADDAPKIVERLLRAYMSNRASPEETFVQFSRRHDAETLRRLADAEVAA
ncbi:MAG: NirA family protein, partial [Xanthobacteraceae bacterium]